VTVVFFDVMSTLDGFAAPEGMDLDHVDNPGYKNWMSKWTELTSWIFKQKFFRENLKIGEGGETGQDNQMLENTFNRTGASIMGKRMFDAGERLWPEEAPFHTSVYVLTHQVRKPWERPGGTTFYFVNDGLESALDQARKASGGRDVRIAGGANVIQQFLNAGLIDEFTVHFTPIFFGQGTPLFSGVRNDIKTKIKQVSPSAEVIHVTYTVER
jgi:dihydrofolate reductase